MDTKKLRQKILDLAIHGKLVPQDPNDEPASVLLERIKAEKEQLIKEGKIKRQKKSTSSDTSHYENDVPFEVPDGWVWCKVNDIALSILYGVSEPAKSHGQYKLLRITDIQNNSVNWNNVPYADFDTPSEYFLRSNDILFARTGATVGKSYLVEDVDNNCIYASYLIRIRCSLHIYAQYVKRFFESGFYWEQITSASVGVGQPNVNGSSLCNLMIPIPPIEEQKRIVDEVEKWFIQIDAIEQDSSDLKDTVQKAKSKILDFALSGRLTSHTSHYPQLPDGWEYKQLDEVLDYEQPQKYIVESTEYSDDYTTPVLTAGKSFIIGHTNERSGICTNVPVIIFDDFTTDSKFVDFPFKVKSSAMKILHPKGDINLKYLAYFMSITRLVGTTHKRYWISEYSKIKVPVPPKEEQDKIVFLIEKFYSLLDSLFVDQS